MLLLLPQGRGRGGASDAVAVGRAATGVAAYAAEWWEEEEGRSEEEGEERRWWRRFDVVGIGRGKGLKVEEEEEGTNEDECGVDTGKIFIIVMPIIPVYA